MVTGIAVAYITASGTSDSFRYRRGRRRLLAGIKSYITATGSQFPKFLASHQLQRVISEAFPLTTAAPTDRSHTDGTAAISAPLRMRGRCRTTAVYATPVSASCTINSVATAAAAAAATN